MDFYNVPVTSSTYISSKVEEAQLYSIDFPYTFQVDLVLILRDEKLSSPMVAICEKWDDRENVSDEYINFHIVGYLQSVTYTSKFLTLKEGKDVLFKHMLDGLPQSDISSARERGKVIPIRHKTVKEALHTSKLFKRSHLEIVNEKSERLTQAFSHMICVRRDEKSHKNAFYEFKESLPFVASVPYRARFDS